ncbi:hypothetical protein Esti_002451 [Eimeria stiedai]
MLACCCCLTPGRGEDGERFWRVSECFLRGNMVKYARLQEEVVGLVKEEKAQPRDKPPTRGRGRGRGISVRAAAAGVDAPQAEHCTAAEAEVTEAEDALEHCFQQQLLLHVLFAAAVAATAEAFVSSWSYTAAAARAVAAAHEVGARKFTRCLTLAKASLFLHWDCYPAAAAATAAAAPAAAAIAAAAALAAVLVVGCFVCSVASFASLLMNVLRPASSQCKDATWTQFPPAAAAATAAATTAAALGAAAAATPAATKSSCGSSGELPGSLRRKSETLTRASATAAAAAAGLLRCDLL